MRFVNVEFHPIEFLKQVVREFDVRLVDLVDEEDRTARVRVSRRMELRGEGLTERPEFDVAADVLHVAVAEANAVGIAAADRQVARIENSAQKSLEVASIFQDRIPHTEILERQNTIKYVTAARMAHQGRSIDEIGSALGLKTEAAKHSVFRAVRKMRVVLEPLVDARHD